MASNATPDRPVWYLGPGAMPIAANSAKKPPPENCTHWTREGDAAWWVIETKPVKETAK